MLYDFIYIKSNNMYNYSTVIEIRPVVSCDTWGLMEETLRKPYLSNENILYLYWGNGIQLSN